MIAIQQKSGQFLLIFHFTSLHRRFLRAGLYVGLPGAVPLVAAEACDAAVRSPGSMCGAPAEDNRAAAENMDGERSSIEESHRLAASLKPR